MICIAEDAIMTVDVKLMSKDDITRHLNDTVC